MVFQNDILAGASGAGVGYQIDQSIRFNDNDSAYLSRTTSGAGNRKTFTISLWFKRGNLTLSGSRALISAWTGSASDSGRTCLLFNNNDDTLAFSGYATNWRWTNAVFRDPSAWYHVVVAVDTTQATANDRIKMYINGELQTSFLYSGNPGLNADLAFNDTASDYYIAYEAPAVGGAGLYDGYESEIYLIDGQALAPTDFGETNADGVWVPKAYAGTYGTNGFYLKGQDSSNLGDDSSGNTNDFTASGLTSADQVTDSPTLNFPVISPIDYQTGSNVTISNGNLTFQNANSGSANDARATFAVSSGKWYWEVEADSLGQSGVGREFIGVVSPEWRLGTGSAGSNFSQDSTGYAYNTVGQKINNGSAASYGSSLSAGDIVGVALDLDNGKIWWSVNGTFQASGDPAAGTNEAYSGLSGTFAPAFAVDYGVATSRLIANFGQTGGLTYTPPTGFSQIDSSTLPAPTIKDGSAYFQTTLYTGDGNATQTITQSENSTFNPDFIWIKNRSNAYSHNINDAVRGYTGASPATAADVKVLASNATDREGLGDTITTAQQRGFVQSSTSNGFIVNKGTAGSQDGFYTNASGHTYAAWQWLAANGTVSNTNGSITSTVSANTTAGISVLTFAGSGGTGTVGHGLSQPPNFIIVKSRDTSNAWYTGSDFYTTWEYYQTLNSTAAQAAGSTVWNSTAPTSSVFSIGASLNTSAEDYVAYCWHSVEGFSKFGSYTGNGSADGPFVFTGFKPAFVIAKRTNSADNWAMYDAARDPYNVAEKYLLADATNAEATFSTAKIDFLSNGFKWRGAVNFGNASGGTYIFMAFAEHPFGGTGAVPVPAR